MPTAKKPTKKKPARRIPDPPRIFNTPKRGRPSKEVDADDEWSEPMPRQNLGGSSRAASAASDAKWSDFQRRKVGRKRADDESDARIRYEATGPIAKNRAELRQIAMLTKEAYQKVLDFMVRGSVAELEEICSSGESTVLEAMVGSLAYRVITHGDVSAHEAIISRLIGKMTDKLDVTGNGMVPQVVIQIPSNGREAL